MNALSRLAAAAARAAAPDALVAISGAVADVTPTTYRVRGLSAFAALGDCVALDPCGRRHGEIVRVDADSVTVKPFATTADVRLGARATIVSPPSPSPRRPRGRAASSTRSARRSTRPVRSRSGQSAGRSTPSRRPRWSAGASRRR